eukprot:GDKK01019330.1.p1 GENE.GDKK01019330.1~~GDKK01019330.1.p1  ORF type:complete len:130 (+),score=22.46 GDKK01019330.1:53-391(+)
MDSDSFDAMGERVYNRLSANEKEALMAHIASAVASSSTDDSHSGGAKWTTVVRGKIAEIIQRRQEEGESLDASEVVDEVLPMAIASIPVEVRKQLFAKVRKMVAPNSQNPAL